MTIDQAVAGLADRWRATMVATDAEQMAAIEAELTSLRIRRGVVANRTEVLRSGHADAQEKLRAAGAAAAASARDTGLGRAKADRDTVEAAICTVVRKNLPALLKALAAEQALETDRF